LLGRDGREVTSSRRPGRPRGTGPGGDQLGVAPGHRRRDAGGRPGRAGDAGAGDRHGTGYTAALLAHRLGAGNVTTIEVDPDLAAWARAALEHAGCGDVTVITGDGARGYPAGAPFDRVPSSVAAPRGALRVGGPDPAWWRLSADAEFAGQRRLRDTLVCSLA
jgi:hypothetical protein